MMRFYVVLLFFTLYGCVSYSPSIPKGFSGDTASIDDSFRRTGGGKADFFYIKLIDGRPIENALTATQSASFGTGRLRAKGASRPVLVKPLTLTLVGQVHHFAPIGYMLNSGDNYEVEGEITFEPKNGEMYLINGYLSKDRSAVWIEDINGNVVSKVLEKMGQNQPVAKDSDINSIKKNQSREEFFLSLSGGETVSFVKAKLGDPDKTSKYEPSFFNNERLPSVTYTYNGLGSIEFSLVQSKPAYVERLMPEVDFANDIETLSMQLNTDGRTLQYITKEYSKIKGLEADKLDVFAKKIWIDRDTDDKYVIDALSWMCKILGNSGNSRYKELLTEVAVQAKSKKIKKYARSGLERLPNYTSPQFIP